MTGAYAQNGSSTTSPATVTFTLDFPQSSPAHYSITADSSGKGTYTSEATKADLSPDQPANAEPFRYNFTLSPATREKIFELAARAKYFSGNVDYTKHNIANTGAKSLAYKDAKRNTEAKYNYTTNAAIQELTTLFQSISSTLEFGQRLDYAYRYQKLALDDQLKSVEESAKQNGLAELQAIAPLLKQIAADHSVMNVTRARAERLLARAGVANSGTN
jgi:hypothetical protein